MRKEKIKKIALFLLPVFAVGMAMQPNSVLMFDPGTEKTTVCSYFSLLPEGTFQISTVLAGLLASISGGLALVFLTAKKKSVLKPIIALAMASSIFSVLPVLLPTTIKILPNVAMPILLLAQAVVAYYCGKEPKEAAKKLKRL